MASLIQPSDEELSQVNYYLQRGYHHHAFMVCETGLRKRPADPVLQFWKAFSTILKGKVAEGMREITGIQEKRDLLLVAPLALIYGHNRSKLVDHEAVQELQAKLTILGESSSTTDRAYIQAGLFHWHVRSLDSAHAMMRKAMEISPLNAFAATMLAWIDLTLGKESAAIKCGQAFDAAFQRNPKDIDAIMGRARHQRIHRHQPNQSIETISQLTAYYPSYIPAYIERLAALLELGAWDMILESAQRLLSMQMENVDALMMITCAEFCTGRAANSAGRGSGGTGRVGLLNLLIEAINKNEPNNANLCYKTVQLFARLASRNSTVLDILFLLIEKACSLDPKSSVYWTEMAYVMLCKGDLHRARDSYQKALDFDSHNVQALEGVIRCQMYAGQYSFAEEQLEFLNEIQTSMGRSAGVAYLTSLLAWYKYNDTLKCLKWLKEAVDIQMKMAKIIPMSVDFFVAVNPEFLLDIVRVYFEFCPATARREGEETNPVVRTVLELLQFFAKYVPGNVEGLCYLAQAKYLDGDRKDAHTFASNCLKLDGTYSKAHILMAQIHIDNGQPKLALQSLDFALSYNFEVRNLPVFNLIKARASKAEGSQEEALKILHMALSLPGVRETKVATQTLPGSSSKDEPTRASERVAIYLELADSHSKLQQHHEATKVMQDALRIFAGTREEGQITIANANLALDRGEADVALSILGGIGPEQLHFIEAKSKMAEIYLKHKRDRRAYARCYRELMEKNPTLETCFLLGDAYMMIQAPEDAIQVFQSTLAIHPESTLLASKIGKAYVKTHDYSKAIRYYGTALQNDRVPAPELRYDLADLHRKLREFDNAERVILEALDHPSTEDLPTRQSDVKLLILLGSVYKMGNQPDKAAEALSKARDLQSGILSKQASEAENQRRRGVACNVCFELAELYAGPLKDTDKAMSYYNDAIQYNSTSKKPMLALARLHAARGDLTAAQNQCATMLRADAGNEEATMMIADTMFRQNSHESAIFHYRQLLESHPTHWVALSKLIEMLRRSGKLGEVESAIQNAEKASPKAKMESGYHYCKGFYCRYTNNPSEALKHFSFARRDTEWGEQAVQHMIEIFLSPDNDTLSGESLDNVTDMSNSNTDKGDSEMLAILTADKLLKELPSNPKPLRHQVLECHALMATKQKAEVERALLRLNDILTEDGNFVPALLATAIGCMVLKQAPKARIQLKRISKMEWCSDFADDFERSWLLLADMYIQGGKFDIAQELLKRCLVYNKSCAKACEYSGVIMEKEQAYRGAAEFYENAWALEKETNPAIGYKLAYNYMKAKRFVEAVDVCHTVLRLWPEYPKIKKEIMEKARANIRMPVVV